MATLASNPFTFFAVPTSGLKNADLIKQLFEGDTEMGSKEGEGHGQGQGEATKLRPQLRFTKNDVMQLFYAMMGHNPQAKLKLVRYIRDNLISSADLQILINY